MLPMLFRSSLGSHLKQDTVEVGTYLRHAYPYAKLVIMGWHLSSKSKKNNPQVDVWIFSNDRIFRI